MTSKEAARERLLSAELAQVLNAAAFAGPDTNPWRARWIAAAVVLFGAFVTVSVAWLRADDATTAAQEPVAFDPVFPWYEQEFPWVMAMPIVTELDDLAELPPEVDRLSVSVDDQELLLAVIRRGGIRALQLYTKVEPVRLGPAVWQALGGMNDLEALATPRLRASAAEIRELRRLPNLRTLVLAAGDIELDAEIGGVLAELSKLRAIVTSGLRLHPEGIAALANLPDLDVLYFDSSPLDDAAFDAITKLRGLRSLLLFGAFQQDRSSPRLTAAQMRKLAGMPRLAALSLTHFELDDEVLRQLPRTLQSLSLTGVQGVTAAGLRAVGAMQQLRSLRVGEDALPLQDELMQVIAALPLERFTWAGRNMPATLWSALQQRPRLRGLCFGRSKDLAATMSDCAKVTALELLEIGLEHAPNAEQLAPLVGHAALRRLVILGPAEITPKRLAELRARLGEQVEVIVR
ncbi:MAG: hypothetical protein KDC98_20570 [Planctomycetes bacterium]|nr:hypothetical protein [Planctomycetota bacterium]